MNRIIERMFIEKTKNNLSDESEDNRNDDDTGGCQDGDSSSEGKSGSRNTEKKVN